MAVNLHGDLRVCMTELLADVENVRPIEEELRSEDVPQVLKPDVPKARLAQHPLEVASLGRANLVAYRLRQLRLSSALFRSVQLWGIDENQ